MLQDASSYFCWVLQVQQLYIVLYAEKCSESGFEIPTKEVKEAKKGTHLLDFIYLQAHISNL